MAAGSLCDGTFTNSYLWLDHLTLGTSLLSGTLPTQIGLLTQLIHLDLLGNSISGSLPPQIGTKSC